MISGAEAHRIKRALDSVASWAAEIIIVLNEEVADGTEEVAGAYLAPDSLARAAAQGLNARNSLASNDGHGFFGAIGDAVVTGPTLTNVNDFRAILITEAAVSAAVSATG